MARLIQICVVLLAFSAMVSAAPCQDNKSTTESHSMDGSNHSTGTSNHVTSKPMDSQMVSDNDKKMFTDPCQETICDDAHDIKQVKSNNNGTSNMILDVKQVKSKVELDSGSSANQLQSGLINLAAGDHIGTKNVNLRHIASNILMAVTRVLLQIQILSSRALTKYKMV
ncbi:unnamed protein product [Rhizopus stolonifer]